MGAQPRKNSRLVVAAVVVILVVAAALVAASSLGGKTTTTTNTTSTVMTTASTTASSQVTTVSTSSSSTSAPTSLSGTFVSRFCSNSSAIPVAGVAAAALTPSGAINMSSTETGATFTNTGQTAVTIRGVCVDAVGVVPSTDVGGVTGSTGTSVELGVSPNALVQPGQTFTVSATFFNGAEINYLPQSGGSITVITVDGSSAKESLSAMTASTTGTLAASAASISGVSLKGGATPNINVTLTQGSSEYLVGNVDVYINNTYVGTIPFGPSPGSGILLTGSYAINEPGRIQVVSGDRYTVTLAVATVGGELGIQLSSIVVAG